MLAGGAASATLLSWRKETSKTMSKSASNFLHALVAVLVGNAAYFLLEKHLPMWARHVGFRTDLGTLVDFCFCLVVFGLIKTLAAEPDLPRQPKS
jgi:hypothetical protein